MASDVLPAHVIDNTLPPSERVPNGVDKPSNNNSTFTFFLSSANSLMPPWGENVSVRDKALRTFWPTESTLASSFCSQIARYASFPYSLEGPERMTHIYESVFESCENGEGFISMMTKATTDLYTQDNGAFIELIRTTDSPVAPVVSMRHKDAARCLRTGNWDKPVIYLDLDNKPHLMPWYSIMPLSEMPSPDVSKRGLQYSVLTRVLAAAQTMLAMQNFIHEEVSGLKVHELHLIGGFNQELLDSTMAQKLAAAMSTGRTNVTDPVLLAALLPEGRVTHEEVTLSKLPPDFDLDKFMKWYIENIALAWEDEYSSFAPLPGGNLGTAQQSETMADKARAKGPAMFMRIMEHKFNFYGVLPKTVKMKYGEQDPIADQQKTQLFWRFAQILKLLVDSLIITPEIAQLLLRDAGYLKLEYLQLLGQTDPTPQNVNSDRPVS